VRSIDRRPFFGLALGAPVEAAPPVLAPREAGTGRTGSAVRSMARKIRR
jgi:hypothetical protein